MTATIADTDNSRVENSPIRHQYRILTDGEKYQIGAIKDAGENFLHALPEGASSRELSIARTKIEEAVMWAVKHVTA
ncbi:MAG: hypothetical protein Q4G22_04770 [Paracoccus sp. (in: a-proteobacteria)]|uniref:Acb2/Tad1 domain-containing protein n=1 Tax=Paracoccus sp. TaxID=267 RepID=UPI0026E0566C|nr:hypothetical protein [Paracoccus sp. (in: a-proteobacteria)]MDO5631132.1 hypothetical protein [Paracoccus sp. (in: a-proteobacteria)]